MLSRLPEQIKITNMEQVKNPGHEPHHARHRAPIYIVSGKAYGNGGRAESVDISSPIERRSPSPKRASNLPIPPGPSPRRSYRWGLTREVCTLRQWVNSRKLLATAIG